MSKENLNKKILENVSGGWEYYIDNDGHTEFYFSDKDNQKLKNHNYNIDNESDREKLIDDLTKILGAPSNHGF
jgi:hypothetical protein